MKRIFDLMATLLFLPFIFLMCCTIAFFVKIKLGSPVIFTQPRPGLNSNIFNMIKFRTMTNESDKNGLLKPDSVRLTKFGKFLRSTSLDELPGLWNVLKGDMSLVGPRPLLVEYLPLYSEKQSRRHEVRPGITGWAQVNGRNAISWDEKFDLDVVSLISIAVVIWKIKPKYVLSYTIKPVIYGMLAAKFIGVRHRFALITGLGVVFEKGASASRKILLLLVKILYKASLSASNKVFFQNPDDRELFVNQQIVNSSKSFVVNGSGVDLSHYGFSNTPESVSFLMMSRLLKSKGVFIYFEAAKNIKARHSDVRFSLAGEIDPLNRDSISQFELDSWVESGIIDYYGHLSDVRQAIVDCSVYVLPSFYREGTPRSILESMSMGRAVITTNTPGCKETVVDGENGYLVAPRSVSELSDAMLRFIEDPHLSINMGFKSRQIAEEKYNVSKVNAFMLKEMEV